MERATASIMKDIKIVLGIILGFMLGLMVNVAFFSTVAHGQLSLALIAVWFIALAIILCLMPSIRIQLVAVLAILLLTVGISAAQGAYRRVQPNPRQGIGTRF